jgi:DNA-directed RNA polymerase subunit RPC12/RpoP
VRNQVGAHFNTATAGIGDTMVRKFARCTLALDNALNCSQCGQLPKRDKIGEYWQCGGACGSKRLRLLRSPECSGHPNAAASICSLKTLYFRAF